MPFGLLGCEAFLSQWVVTFNAYRGYTIVESLDSFEERPLPVDTWEEFQKGLGQLGPTGMTRD